MTANRRVFILLGAPGVGKGTQAQRIAEAFSLYHIDTGHALRTEMAMGTELGLTAKGYMDKGELVPFDLVMQVIKAAMLRIGAEKQGYLFDGFPRNLQQAEGLNTVLSELELTIDAALYLETPFEILMDRLAYRVTCAKCDAKYNLKLSPPKAEGVCDKCGGELVTRKDDRPEVIGNRLQAYEQETAPLIGYYSEQGKLHQVNADQPMDAVFDALSVQMKPFFDSSATITV